MLFTIKDIENLSGIKAHTIRIWEQRYSLLKPSRSDTNIRYYTNEELKKILTIALLNKYGYKISHIDKMSEETMAENVLSLTDAEAKENVLINTLLQCMINYEIEEFENLLSRNIAARGMEMTILKIIFPFLEKVGVLWVTNHVNPAQEHLVSNVIRQKIIVAIDEIFSNKQSSKTVCLFLPEGEYHEVSLLLVNYLLRKKGVHTIYLGAHSPFAEVGTIVKHRNPDFLYTHITSASQNFNFDKFITTLHKEFSEVSNIIISGRLTKTYIKKLPPGIIFKNTLGEVREFINQI
ncbi:MAG: MerR family transcriptional regulator [Ginsengibacter sp.]